MIQKFLRVLTCFFLGTFLFLNAGAIRKNEDPITNTQTDPISLKDKLEETKDGVKGAPTPSFTYYQKEQFLEKTAVDEEEDADKSTAAAKPLAEVSEVDFEEEQPDEEAMIVQESSGEEDDEWWVEEESPEESQEQTDLQG